MDGLDTPRSDLPVYEPKVFAGAQRELRVETCGRLNREAGFEGARNGSYNTAS
jgi:hypothetical protein